MSTSRPDPELLPDGDILAPERLRDGTYRMIRLAPEHPDHAGWLGEIQDRPKPQQQSGAPVGGIIVGLLLPVVGVV